MVRIKIFFEIGQTSGEVGLQARKYGCPKFWKIENFDILPLFRVE